MNIKDVEALAALARLELTQEEKGVLLKDMEGILGYVKQIGEVKVGNKVTEGVLHNAWREDLPAQAGAVEKRDFSPELIIGQFPNSQDNFLKVKKIL